MAHRWGPEIPVDLRARLEAARLDLLALFRWLDQRQLSAAEIPQPLLRQLLELDADFAEALWALDQPPDPLNLGAMLRDTLGPLPIVSARLRKQLPPPAPLTLQTLEASVRKAYRMVPGKDPENG